MALRTTTATGVDTILCDLFRGHGHCHTLCHGRLEWPLYRERVLSHAVWHSQELGLCRMALFCLFIGHSVGISHWISICRIGRSVGLYGRRVVCQ